MCCNPASEHSSCIHHVPIFHNMKEEELCLLESVVYSSHYDKGTFIFREREQSDALFVLNQGFIKLTKIADTGKEHIIRFLFPGDFFGIYALLQMNQNYANAEVIEPSVVCRIHRDDFKRIIEGNPSMTYPFLLAVTERLQQSDEWAGALHLFEVENRLAIMLLYFLQKNPISHNKLFLPTSKKELAIMIGTTPETLSRKLSHLESLNVISVKKRIINLLNLTYLQQLAGQN